MTAANDTAETPPTARAGTPIVPPPDPDPNGANSTTSTTTRLQLEQSRPREVYRTSRRRPESRPSRRTLFTGPPGDGCRLPVRENRALSDRTPSIRRTRLGRIGCRGDTVGEAAAATGLPSAPACSTRSVSPCKLVQNVRNSLLIPAVTQFRTAPTSSRVAIGCSKRAAYGAHSQHTRSGGHGWFDRAFRNCD